MKRTNSYTSPTDVIYMYTTIIPAEWGLSKTEYPEKWLFAVAADRVVITAQPLDLDHDMYPVVTIAPDDDGYSCSPISRLEQTYGLQVGLNYMYNSHMSALRKSVHDMFVVDPSKIVLSDMYDTEKGIFRLRPQAFGTDVAKAVQQLNVNDITRNNVVDAIHTADIMRQVTGATDSLSGTRRERGERVSAQEARDVQMGALSRLERVTLLTGMQGIQDLAMICASHTQQLISRETYGKVVGNWEKDLAAEYGIQTENGYVPIRPSDLSVAYDIIVEDANQTGREYADVWIQLLQIAASQPNIYTRVDVYRVFKHIARLLGAKSFSDFELKPSAEVIPDAQVQEMIANGDLSPNQLPWNGAA